MTDLEADGKVQELQGSCEDVAEERGGPMVGRTAAARQARTAEQSRQLAAYSGNHHHHLPMPHIPAKPRRVNSHQVHPQFSVGIPNLHMLQALVPMNTCPSPVHHERGSKIVNVMQNSYVTMQSSCQGALVPVFKPAAEKGRSPQQKDETGAGITRSAYQVQGPQAEQRRQHVQPRGRRLLGWREGGHQSRGAELTAL